MNIRDLMHIFVAYVVTIGAAGALLYVLDGSLVWDVLWADLLATVVIFMFSRGYKNSSFYDAYWSVIPPLIALYWATVSSADDIDLTRRWLVVLLVWLWGIRLTANWAKFWPGLHHEDWRYGPIKQGAGRLDILADFSAIHLFPTAIVFLACLPIYAAVAMPAREFNGLDWLAALLTFLAVIISLVSDIQLHRFLKTRQEGEIMAQGLWRYSRHPNYFGEWLFWFGLMLFGLAARPESWAWIVPGAIAMLIMFLAASIPMIDKRSLERRPNYGDHMKAVSGFLPLPPRK